MFKRWRAKRRLEQQGYCAKHLIKKVDPIKVLLDAAIEANQEKLVQNFILLYTLGGGLSVCPLCVEEERIREERQLNQDLEMFIQKGANDDNGAEVSSVFSAEVRKTSGGKGNAGDG